MKTSTIRLAGALIALGGIIWFITRLVVGPQPDDSMHATELAGGGIFQLGLIAMFLVIRATGGAGTGRGGRFVVNTGLVFMALATLWTVLAVLAPGLVDNPAVLVLDVFWPLSMVWLIVVGVAVMRARTWPSPARYLPFVGSFVIPVHLLAELIGLTEWQSWAGPVLYLAIAYLLLGVVVIRRIPLLAEDRPEAVRAAVTAAR